MKQQDINIDFPSTWNDLSNNELKLLSKSIYNDLNAFELAVELIKNRLDKKSFKLLRKLPAVKLSEQLSFHLEDFFTDAKLNRMPVTWLTRKDLFQDVTTGEYEKVIDALENKKTYLEIIEILFPKEIKRISKRPWLQILMMTWIRTSLESINASFSELKEGGGGEGIGNLGFTDLIHAGAGERNGTRVEIRETLIWEFLYDMLLQKRIADRMTSKNK